MTPEDAKYIVIGTEDGWLSCSKYKDWKKYLEAKRIVKNTLEVAANGNST